MSKKKEISGKAKLHLPAGKATPGQPVGPVVSPLGINIKQFCDDFNNQTKDKAGYIIPVEIIAFKDKSYKLILKQPPVPNLILKFTSIAKGSSLAGKESAGILTDENVEKIVDMKMPDFNTVSRESAKKMITGTAISMGIKVES
jgi:large subunit ribosomal protein L11